MGNLGTRQKIILGIMAIVILYAAADFLLPKTKNPAVDPKQKQADLTTFVAGLTAAAGKDSSRNLGPLIFSRAEREWTHDPFLDERSYRAWITPPKAAVAMEKEKAAPKIEFFYTGFLESDRKRMVVINGMEYKEGDELDIKGYVLKSISPASVVIVNRATRAEQTVPLEE